jgi:hypothetical protein
MSAKKSLSTHLLLNTKEAAEVLCITPILLNRFAKNRLIGFYQFGGETTPRKYSKKHIQDFLELYHRPPIEQENVKIENLIDNDDEI